MKPNLTNPKTTYCESEFEMSANKIREIRLIRENPRFRRYPEYKETGMKWVREIPEHWRVERAKFIFRRLQRPVRENDEIITAFRDGIVTLRKNRRTLGFTNSLKEIGYQGLRKGDLVIHAMDGHAGAIGVSDSDGKSSPVYSVCRPISEENVYYYAYLLRYIALSGFVESLARGVRERSTEFRFNEFKELELPIPTVSEQTQIVGFLDRKTGRIDELIRIKERQIELLQEQRTALINQVVTKGLDPNVEMKPSGVEWIGHIPGHWIISKVKHEFKSLDNFRIPLNAETRGSMRAKVYDYYGASGVIDKVENYIFDEPLILIGEDGANLHLRSTPLAFKATGKYWVNNHAHVLRPKRGNIDYLTNMLESFDYTHYITGAAQPKLTSEHLMNITVIIPPPVEQQQIANLLNRKTQQIDDLIAAEQRKIELLKEYRQSLISEAVTGKIDVRNEV